MTCLLGRDGYSGHLRVLRTIEDLVKKVLETAKGLCLSLGHYISHDRISFSVDEESNCIFFKVWGKLLRAL